MEPATKKLCSEISAEDFNNTSKEDINNGKEKIKTDINEDGDAVQPLNFKDFKLTKVLNNMEHSCSIALQGKFGENKEENTNAVILLQKLAFSEDAVPDFLNNLSNIRTLFENDVYHNQIASIPPKLNEIKINTIFPANDSHINKYKRGASSFVVETPKLYTNVTLPFIQKCNEKSKQWIYNILEHKSESERIVCEDTDDDDGFVLVPDLKWSGEHLEQLYLQAIIKRRDLFSIRNLRAEHLPLLNNIYEKCTKAIKEKYGLPSCKLRVFLHYLPSFYHLHVHFSALSFDAPGIWPGKAHLLKDVINNLNCVSDYYEKASLSITVKESHAFYGFFESEGCFKED